MAAPSNSGYLRPFVTTTTLLLIFAALYLARAVVVPVVLSALLAFLLTPVVSWLQHWRVPRVVAAVGVSLLAFSFIGAVLMVVLIQFGGLAKDLTKPENQKRIHEKAASLHQMLSGDEFRNLTNLLDETVQTISPPSEPPPSSGDPRVVGSGTVGLLGSHSGQGPLLAAAALYPETIGAAQGPPPPPPAASPTANFWGPLMEWAFTPALEVGVDVGIIFVLVIFMLAQHEDLRNRMIRLSGTRNVTSTTKALGEAARRVRNYLQMQFFINFAFGVVVALGLSLIGVPYPWLWGVFGALLRYVPYIGTWLGAVCPVLLSIALSDGWTQPLMTVGLFVLLDAVITNALEPIIYGRSIGVSGTALLVAAVFWTWMWGPIGLILSTPLTACVVVLGRTVPSLEFLSVALSDHPPLSPHLIFYHRLLARDEDEASELVEEHLQKNEVETVYDNLLLPALVHAKEERQRGAMTTEDEEFIVGVMGRLLEDVVFPEQDALDTKETAKGGEEVKCRLLVLGFPAGDDVDELALRMLQRLLPAGKCQLEVLSKGTLVGEVLTRAAEAKPAVVVIGATPRYSFSTVRYLCKRLRERRPEVRIVVGCWGLREDVKPTVERLISAGADLASAELVGTRSQLLPLIQEASVRRAAHEAEPKEAVHV